MIEIGAAILAGLLIGSFLNVCIFRLPRDLSVVTPRVPFAPAVKRRSPGTTIFRLLSYLLLGARCRHCKARIPIRYPIVELATAAAFAVCVAALGWSARRAQVFLFFRPS